MSAMIFQTLHYLIDSEPILHEHKYSKPFGDALDELNWGKLLPLWPGGVDVRVAEFPDEAKEECCNVIRHGVYKGGVTYTDKDFCEQLRPEELKMHFAHCINNHIFNSRMKQRDSWCLSAVVTATASLCFLAKNSDKIDLPKKEDLITGLGIAVGLLVSASCYFTAKADSADQKKQERNDRLIRKQNPWIAEMLDDAVRNYTQATRQGRLF